MPDDKHSHHTPHFVAKIPLTQKIVLRILRMSKSNVYPTQKNQTLRRKCVSVSSNASRILDAGSNDAKQRIMIFYGGI